MILAQNHWAPGVRVAYLYDDTATAPALNADWGFACLVQGRRRTVLFDTGPRRQSAVIQEFGERARAASAP